MPLFRSPYAPGARLDLGGIAVRLRVNPRARRVSLRMDARTGEAVATAPSPRRLSEAVAFAKSRRAWIAERVMARGSAPVLEGEIILFGVVCALIADGRRPVVLYRDDGLPLRIAGCGQGRADPGLVVRAVRRAALTVFQARIAGRCAELGVAVPTLALGDPRSRWGSCSPARPGRGAAIRLSWRLALAPYAVADYVVAHECAHLIEANHGPEFWRLVHRLVGDPAPHRDYLRRHGPRLHAFGRTP